MKRQNTQNTARIATYGFEPDLLASLNRTGSAYRRALTSNFQLLEGNSIKRSAEANLLFSDISGRVIVRSNAPLVIPLHGGAVSNFFNLQKSLSKLRKCDRLIANCSADLAVLSKVLVDSDSIVRLIPLPVNCEVFKPIQKVEARRLLGLSGEVFVVGFVGRLIPQKGIHYFLKAIAESRQIEPFKKIIGIAVGDYQSGYPLMEFVDADDYRSYLASLIQATDLENSLLLIGAQPDDRSLRAIYSSMDICLHLTHTVDENFGYAPLEAMACEVPVISTAYGGMRDSIVHQETGFLVDTWATAGGLRSDFSQAVRFVQTLLSDDFCRHEMGARARRHVVRNFSYVRFQNLLQSVFQEAISCSGETQALELFETPSPLLHSYLPKKQPDWSEIYPAVKMYAAGMLPLKKESWLCWSYGLQKISNNKYKSFDPAWPAEYDVTVTEHEIIQRCSSTQLTSNILEKYGERLPLRLLDMGILSIQSAYA